MLSPPENKFPLACIIINNNNYDQMCVLLNSGEMRQALEAAKKAKRILAIYLGPNHSDSRDLDEMIKLFN